MNLVYDLAFQPAALGDLLTHQAASLVLRGDCPVDVTIACDWHKPAPEALLQAARVNQYFGRLNYVHRNEIGNSRKRWPLEERYTTYDCWEILAKHYWKHGSIPALRPLKQTEDWAREFVGDAVTISLRRTGAHADRNSDYAAWQKFLSNHPETDFVIACRKDEADAKMASLPNVRFFTGDAEKVCAIICVSRIHLGVGSGPLQMRWYQEKPFCAFKDPIRVERVVGMHYDGDSKKMPWHTERQRILAEPDCQRAIEREFERIAA